MTTSRTVCNEFNTNFPKPFETAYLGRFQNIDSLLDEEDFDYNSKDSDYEEDEDMHVEEVRRPE